MTTVCLHIMATTHKCDMLLHTSTTIVVRTPMLHVSVISVSSIGVGWIHDTLTLVTYIGNIRECHAPIPAAKTCKTEKLA